LLDAGAERGSGGDGGKGEDFFEPAGMTQMGVFNAKALGFQTGKTKFNAPALAVDLKRIVAAFQAMRDNGKKFAIGQTFQRQRTPHAIKSGLRPCLRFLPYKASIRCLPVQIAGLQSNPYSFRPTRQYYQPPGNLTRGGIPKALQMCGDGDEQRSGLSAWAFFLPK
jgi:hypothetical protein